MLKELKAKYEDFTKDLYFVTTALPMSEKVLTAIPDNAPWWLGMKRDEIDEVMHKVMQGQELQAHYPCAPADRFALDPEFERHVGHVVDIAAETSSGFAPRVTPIYDMRQGMGRFLPGFLKWKPRKLD